MPQLDHHIAIDNGSLVTYSDIENCLAPISLLLPRQRTEAESLLSPDGMSLTVFPYFVPADCLADKLNIDRFSKSADDLSRFGKPDMPAWG